MAPSSPLIGHSKRTFDAATVQAILLLIGMSVSFYYAMHKFHEEQILHPMIINLLPLICFVFLAMMLPMLTFLSYQADFPSLNPMNPADFVKIAHQSYSAMLNNNMKVNAANIKRD